MFRKKDSKIPRLSFAWKIYHRHDVSTALTGKRDDNTLSRHAVFQNRVLNDYLSYLYQKFVTQHSEIKVLYCSMYKCDQIISGLQVFQ